MKRILTLLVVLLLLGTSGCAGDQANTDSANNDTGGKEQKSNTTETVHTGKTISEENSAEVPAEAWAVENAPESVTPPDAVNSLSLVSQNKRLGLYVDEKTGLIGLLDKETGQYYFSSPPDTENYLGIDPVNFDLANSQLIVNVVDKLGNKVQLLSMTDAVLNQDISVKKDKDTVVCTYDFKANGITIPVEFSLEEDYMQVCINPMKIKEQSEFKVYSIKVMPYFGAIRGEESGYLFIPDGSGAIFKANTALFGTFYADMYGYEDVLEKEAIKNYQEKLLLPVFGIKNGDCGILGIIDSAIAKCGIGAENAEELMQLNNVYPVFNMRTLTSVTLPSKNWVAKTVLVLEKHADLTVPFKARYYPLSKGKNEYTDMALRYRDYLMKDKGIGPLEATELYDGYLDLYGYIKKNKSILGWPMVLDEKLTTLAQVRQIISEYSGKDLKLGIKFNGWVDDGYFYKLPQKAKVAGAVGSESSLKAVSKYARDQRFTLFPSIDPITVYKGGNGFIDFQHAVKTVNNIAFTQYYYPINLQHKNYELPTGRMLSPNQLLKFTNQFMNSYNPLGIGAIAFDEIGNRVYSDYGSDFCSRYQAADYIAQLMKTAGQQNEIMVTAAASYVIGGAKHSIAAPYESSNYLISERSVPFYQIALRGLVNISSPAINLDSEPKKVVLKCFETGTLPMFSFIGGKAEVLKDSSLNHLYAADFNKWKDYSREVMTSFANFNKEIKDKRIIGHTQLQNGVFKTSFEGGTGIIVNYNSTAVTTEDGQQIEPYDYMIVKG